MKILELALHAFGPFTDAVLDLSAGREGLHLIYGPNEAGKSSALRALGQALFGIPAQSSDSFVHPYSKMRIGLTLRAADGRTLQLIRRKGNRNTLLDADGTTPLADGTVERFLSGLTEPEFKSRFALDHEELVQGGKAILQGGGELGAMLFQAGGGLKNLVEVQRALDREIEGLFKSGGAKPRINAGLLDLKQANDSKRKAALHSTEWLEHDTARREASARLAELELQLTAKHAEKRRLERLKEALPLLTRQRSSKLELAQLGEVALLSEPFQKTRLEAQGRREAARAARESTREAIARLDRQIAKLVIADDLLAEADAIERLREGLAADRKARRTLPGEESNLLQALAGAHDLLAEWWPHLLPASTESDERVRGEQSSARADLDARVAHMLRVGEKLRLTRAQKAAIVSLAGERTRMAAEQEQAIARISELAGQLEDAAAELARLAPPTETGALDVSLRQARDQGDLDRILEAGRSRLAGAENQTARTLTQLPLWTGPLETLETACAPTVETIDRLEAEFAQMGTEQEQLRIDRRSTVAEQSEADSALEQLRQIAGTVPTEDDLVQARALRDQLWRLIRRAWESGCLPVVEDVGALLEPGRSPTISPGSLADAFERLERQADAHADRLRREAERVAQQSAALASLHKARQRLEFLEVQEKQLLERVEQARSRWAAAWASLGLDPLSPREMRGWLQLRKDLLKQAAELQDLRTELESLEGKHVLHRQRLSQCLQALGGSPCPPDESLTSLRDRAEAELKRLAELETRRSRLIESSSKLDRQLEAARAQARAVEQRFETWRAQWAAAVASLSLNPDVTIEEAGEVVNQSADLQSRIKEARDSQVRIAALRHEAAQFASDVRTLCQKVAPDLNPDARPGSPSIEIAAGELLRRFRTAQETQTTRKALITQREAEVASARSAEQLLDEASLQLVALCQEARCTEVDDLPRAEQRSRDAIELRDRLKVLDEQIQELCGGEPLEVFRQAALALDLDRFPDQLQALTAEIAQLDADRGELNQVLGREQQVLKQMDGSSRAAEAAELAEELKARLAVDVEEYARLRLAAVVLHEAIDRYRQRSQGPVLDRASGLFAELTLGSFEGLRVDYDDHDQAVLRAVRPGAMETVGIEGLSEGSADQLYLALRLASLEAYLESREPIPLVVDDILIQFDDDRAKAALRALAELSRRTQVVLFSHHEHVCQLAQACVDPAQLMIHRLPGRARARVIDSMPPALGGSG
jgi:uncharacterized protein YhaN